MCERERKKDRVREGKKKDVYKCEKEGMEDGE